MIRDIQKTVEDEILTVVVTCNPKKYLRLETKLLTSENIIDILKEEYNIEKVIKQPIHKVGNTTRERVRLSGTWKFQISTDTKSEKIEEKPKRKYTRKKKQPDIKPEEDTKPASSIRSRMSKLANKKD